MLQRQLLTVVLLGALLLGGLPTASANPLVPSCPASILAGTSITADTYDPSLCEAITGRVFPEALTATDFIGYFEFQQGLAYLEQQYPDMITVHTVAQSYGLTGIDGEYKLPIYVVEITNEKSPVPMDQRQEILFMLSIHGNEKGGREGGFRVLEDLAAGRGFSTETVQDGAGLGTAMPKPTGGNVQTYTDYLDFMRIFLLFPNADGWAKDEIQFVATEAALCGTLFCRTNGNGTDLNRQMPTIGWQFINAGQGRLAMNEPEAQGYNNWMVENHTWDYAIDIHGMLNHENFVAIMMPAGSLSPQEMYRSTRLAETLKQRLNDDPHFATWTSAWQAAETAAALADGAVCSDVDFCLGDVLSTAAVGSSEFAEWSTVWDAIGYTDSGFSGDFFAQTTGLNAPGYDIELAYNHITVDSQYEAGAFFNDYHVQSVREIVKSFMDAAALDVQISYDSQGSRTLYIDGSFVATNLDDADGAENDYRPGGWATSNPTDDHWEYSSTNPFVARPSKYFEDIKPYLRNGDALGTLNGMKASELTPAKLANYDNLIISGSAINDFVAGDATSNKLAEGDLDIARIAAIKSWVEAGGNLVLTDMAVKFLDYSGITKNAVSVSYQYAGASNLDRAHPLTADVRGTARQTFEPVPMGFAVGNNAPSWNVDRAAFEKVGGDSAGTALSGTNAVNLGQLKVGEGSIKFLGALLPDPTEEFYHPYGLDDYATTYSGNQILRNMLGWSQSTQDAPIVIQDGKLIQSDNEATIADDANTSSGGAIKGKKSPGFEVAILGIAIAAIAIARRRSE